MMRLALALLHIFFSIELSQAATVISETDFHSKVVALYSFEPHNLKTAELNAKSIELDQFWSLVKSDPASYLPFLRKELTNPSSSGFFYYDGGKLLLSLSSDHADQTLALRSIPKVDLLDIQPTDYLKTVQWFSSKGFDTREAAFRILAYPKFTAFIPQHALTLGQNYSLIYMLFPMDEEIFENDLIQHLALEKESQSQKSLLLALWYTMTPAGQAAIKVYSEDAHNSSEIREYARQLLNQKPSGIESLSISTTKGLREERRKVMSRPISDEALIEFDKLTVKLSGRL